MKCKLNRNNLSYEECSKCIYFVRKKCEGVPTRNYEVKKLKLEIEPLKVSLGDSKRGKLNYNIISPVDDIASIFAYNPCAAQCVNVDKNNYIVIKKRESVSGIITLDFRNFDKGNNTPLSFEVRLLKSKLKSNTLNLIVSL